MNSLQPAAMLYARLISTILHWLGSHSALIIGVIKAASVGILVALYPPFLHQRVWSTLKIQGTETAPWFLVISVKIMCVMLMLR